MGVALGDAVASALVLSWRSCGPRVGESKRVVGGSRRLYTRMLSLPPTKERELVDEGDHIAWGPS
jgi:hypothetical protein